MKVVAFNGSARKDGNTAALVRMMFEEIEKEGIGTELVQLAGQTVKGCRACYRCGENKDGRCVFDDDIVNDCIAKMRDADGIVLASPVYFSDVTSEMKALIDRAGMVGRANDFMFRRKAGAAVVSVRRGGAIHTFDTINHFFFLEQIIVPGSIYWNLGLGGKDKQQVLKDEEGERTMRELGRNMAYLIKKLASK